MDDRESKEAILRLLREDLDALNDVSKGKQRAGDLTDLDLAIQSMQDDIRNLEISISDHSQAHSTNSAVLTDQNMLVALAREERTANEDHRLALALDRGQPIRAPRPIETESDDNSDAVSTIMDDLMSRLSLKDGSDNGEESSQAASSHQPTTRRIRCVSCFERCDAMLSMGKCRHEFCLECTRQMFLGAIRDEGLYPPRCCGNVIPPGVAMRVLNYVELHEFSQRALEWTAETRVYCGDPTCSKFIPAHAIKDQHGTCPRCGQQTHLTCQSLAHPGIDCPLDENLPLVLETAEAQGWKRCPHCRTMVELVRGCNHMICRCGREFCYICTAVWKTCVCEYWHERRLMDEANQVVQEEVPRNGDQDALDRALERAVHNLVRHIDVGCEHHRGSQWVWRNRGSLQCDICSSHLPEYIFMCSNCRMRACWRCRRHRLR
ncbi:unnamed protein product [Penicillium olsonii]|uniref:RBR-type E3 ubiquitin transferase n=1 Tax=Penicillium olsonii TaxID=99116 RepID=A0A9W4HQC8_PENOL|nr:unnamed protein product [Penicillium olsonii]CAG8092931.1 unnamed protein product [Penicillium olsonii]